MAVTAKKVFDQEVIEKMHISRRKNDSRIDALVQRAFPFELWKVARKPPPEVLCKSFEHSAKMQVLELQHVDVHQQPIVRMGADQFFDHLAEPFQALGMERIIDFVKDRS